MARTRPTDILLRRAIPGAKTTISNHLRRAAVIASALELRFGIGSTPHQWKAKHLRWYLKEQTAAPSTRYDYWLTCREIAGALGRWPDWEHDLSGEWNPHQRKGAGGRPPKLPGKGRTPPARGKGSPESCLADPLRDPCQGGKRSEP